MEQYNNLSNEEIDEKPNEQHTTNGKSEGDNSIDGIDSEIVYGVDYKNKVFTRNMAIKLDLVITKVKPGENWTKVTSKPNLIKFPMTHHEDDAVSLMRKRVVDIVGCCSVVAATTPLQFFSHFLI